MSLQTLDDVRSAITKDAISPHEVAEWYLAEPVMHPRFSQLLNEMQKLLRRRSAPELLLLLGPGGVGKTTLMTLLCEISCHEQREAMERDPDLLPAVYIEIDAPHAGQFLWNPLYKEILKALREPAVAWRRTSPTAGRRGPRPRIGRADTEDLKLDVVEACRARRCGRIFMDELRHINWADSATENLRHLERLKSLANRTGARLIGATAYSSSDSWRTNEQLLRRTKPLHFSRYRPHREGDEAGFRAALTGLLARMPISVGQPDRHWRMFYEGSIGLIGILSLWLAHALEVALEAGSPSLARRFLEETVRSEKDLETLLAHVEETEDRLDRELATPRTDAKQRREFMVRIGLEDPLPASPLSVVVDDAPEAGKPPATIHKPAVAERLPKRDSVGADVVLGD